MSRWVVAAGALAVSLDSMMNIAFPAIAAALAVPPERVRWIIIFYVLTYALTSFAGGAAADRLGHALVFRAGLALSALAFVMGGVAAGLGWLLVARVVQGLGAGLVFGTAPALVTAGAPAEMRGRRLGFLNGAMGLGALGPLVAGFLVESFGWRAVYHVRVPLALGVLVWAAVARSTPVVSERTPVTLGDLARGGVLKASVLAFVARGAIFAIWLLVPFYLVDTRGLAASVEKPCSRPSRRTSVFTDGRPAPTSSAAAVLCGAVTFAPEKPSAANPVTASAVRFAPSLLVSAITKRTHPCLEVSA